MTESTRIAFSDASVIRTVVDDLSAVWSGSGVCGLAPTPNGCPAL